MMSDSLLAMATPRGKKPQCSVERSAAGPCASQAVGRRDVVRSLLAAGCLGALRLPLLGAAGCGGRPASSHAREAARVQAAARARAAPPVELWSWFDLPDDPRSRELSGIAWDEPGRQLWAVQDNSATLISLVPDRDFHVWAFGTTLELDLAEPLDLEGVALTNDGFVLCSEVGPRVFEIDRAGLVRGEVPIPPHFAEARENKSLESLSISPSGRYLFTTSEVALPRDGDRATLSRGTRLRLLRLDRQRLTWDEHAYATDPAPAEKGDYGVADVAALADDELLVLERGFTKGRGNTVRIYRVSLRDSPARFDGLEPRTEDAPVLEKALVVDVGLLPVAGLPPTKGPQPSLLLDNYEGLAIGPRLPDGRGSLVLVSDDNARADQTARVVVLAVR
jgi:hypothetical protein